MVKTIRLNKRLTENYRLNLLINVSSLKINVLHASWYDLIYENKESIDIPKIWNLDAITELFTQAV